MFFTRHASEYYEKKYSFNDNKYGLDNGSHVKQRMKNRTFLRESHINSKYFTATVFMNFSHRPVFFKI
jgi:hypothetical protein